VARYHHLNGPWSIYFVPHGLDEPPPAWLKHWNGDGILCRINSRRMANAVLATGIPCVDLRGALPEIPVPFVGLDNHPIAQMAFDHLLQCGLKNFAFFGRPRGENPPQDLRCDYFVQSVETGGGQCEVFPDSGRRRRNPSWEQEQESLARRLKHLRPRGRGASGNVRFATPVLECVSGGNTSVVFCFRAGSSGALGPAGSCSIQPRNFALLGRVF
jgi:LacI family transcriptional regulator